MVTRFPIPHEDRHQDPTVPQASQDTSGHWKPHPTLWKVPAPRQSLSLMWDTPTRLTPPSRMEPGLTWLPLPACPVPWPGRAAVSLQWDLDSLPHSPANQPAPGQAKVTTFKEERRIGLLLAPELSQKKSTLHLGLHRGTALIRVAPSMML